VPFLAYFCQKLLPLKAGKLCAQNLACFGIRNGGENLPLGTML
jgi:hypothetical protein